MPKKKIPKDRLHDFNEYNQKLNSFPIVKKYLEPISKDIIKKCSNPLAIYWVQLFFGEDQGEIKSEEEKLKILENKIGEANLKASLAEIGATENSVDLNGRIISAKNEILVLDYLCGNNEQIEKIKSIGDWGIDNKIISVKSILDFDLNYKLIELLLRGLFYVEGNTILEKYSDIRLSNQKNMGSKFIKKVAMFLENRLVECLENFDIEINDEYISKNIIDDSLEIKICLYKESSAKKIEIDFKDSIDNQGGLKITFSHNKFILNICYDTDCFWIGGESDNDWLKKEIEIKKSSFDKGYIDFVKKYDVNRYSFIGLINISIHAQHEDHIQKNIEKIGNDIRTWLKDKEYKVMVAFNPQHGFDLARPIVLEF